MKPQIQFIRDTEEIVVPRRIRLTRSESGETGTATFVFIQPAVFSLFLGSKGPLFISGMDLLWDQKKITTNDVDIFFRDGRPFIITCVFVFRNSNEWFTFLNFMRCYSKETGLSFTEGIL